MFDDNIETGNPYLKFKLYVKLFGILHKAPDVSIVGLLWFDHTLISLFFAKEYKAIVLLC